MNVPASFRKSRSKEAAFTIAEAIVSVGVAVIGMAAVMGLNSAHFRLVASARQSSAATLALQSRVEQMRIADWRKMTDAAYIKDTLLASLPQSAAPLGKTTERVIVSAYPTASACQPLIVKRQQNGDRVTVSAGTGLGGQRLAKVELLVTWNGANGKVRTRATNTIISNGGISRMNLPAFGGTLGGGFTDPPPTTPPPTTGNGHGQGNVGGKSGKK